jgi:aspartate aminotransferase
LVQTPNNHPYLFVTFAKICFQMAIFSKLANSQGGSEIVKLGNAINERIRNGETIYNFTIGDFNPHIFPIPKGLENAIVQSYQQQNTNYPPGDGVLELRQAVGSFLKHWQGIDYAPNEIQIASGGRPLIYTIFKTLVDKGDKVIYAVPSWNNNHYVNMCEAEHCLIDCLPENNFMPLAKDIAPHIKGATLLCLCTPQNPTGTTLPLADLQAICQMVIDENNSRSDDEKKLYVLFDQMYWMLTFGNTQHYNPVIVHPAMKAYTIFVDGISKAFAATGVRVGWSLGPAPVIAKIKAILSHIGAWAPMAEQKALANYLQHGSDLQPYLQQFKQAVELRLTSIYNGFMQLKAKGYAVDAIAPQAAIYLTVQLNLVGKKTANGFVLQQQTDVTEYILSQAKIALVPFSAFGADGNNNWYRLSVGTCKVEDIPTVFSNLEQALALLQ